MSQTQLPSDLPARPASPANMRATVRYRCAPATISKVYVSQDLEYQHAWVLDLSTKGMGLILNRAIPLGTLLLIQMKSNDQSQIFELSGHVAHCTALPQGDWSIGCELISALTPEDLDKLL